jgi:hypothetical protein
MSIFGANLSMAMSGFKSGRISVLVSGVDSCCIVGSCIGEKNAVSFGLDDIC